MARIANKVIGIIGFEGANALDIVGPLEAFATASAMTSGPAPYTLRVLGLTRASFRTESGLRLVSDHALASVSNLDTLLIPGGPGLRETQTNALVQKWVRVHAARIRRVVSVCTGIYGLAPTGLLDGRHATTHWRFAADVLKKFPLIKLEADALHLKDGPFYTAAGITSGIDLALALIEEDLGQRTALCVARELVVYLKRAGGQSQYSEPLRYQMRTPDLFAELVAWIHGHLSRDLSNDALAQRVNMSSRHFSRRFIKELGCTPAAYVEQVRMQEAKQRLIVRAGTIEAVALSLGFRSADVFSRRFNLYFGILPKAFRARFGSSLSRPNV
jgi:transcriptional regulator GlxA family with amidase domain